jgi:hypothetical protein
MNIMMPVIMMIYPCLGVSARDLASELVSLELEFKLPVTRMLSGIGNRDLKELIMCGDVRADR